MKSSVRGRWLAAAVLLAVLRIQAQGANEVLRLDPALDQIVSTDTRVERLVGGFGFVEGPVWVRQGGYLLFSDIPANVINKWTDRKSTRLNSSHVAISYAVFCLK